MSTHAPQFRSNLFCSEINSNHPCQHLNGSLSPKQTVHRIPILPLGKGYKYLCLPSRWHFYCSIAPPSLLLKNSSAPPPPLQPEHRPRVSSSRTTFPTMASISEILEVHFSFPTCISAIYSPSDFFSRVSYLRPFSSRILGAI